MDVNATAERMGRRQGQGQSFLLRATNLGTLGYGGGRERDFTAFIKPGGFLGRSQTKKITKKIIKKDHKDELEYPQNQAISTQHPI